jgi:hypothetical protein
MEEYSLYFGIVCVILAGYVLVKGVVAAVRKRTLGSDSMVPPPAYGVIASILLTYAFGFLKVQSFVETYTGQPVPWWGFRAIFPGTTMLFPAIIYIIGRRPPSK